MGFIQNSFSPARSSLSVYVFVMLITVQSLSTRASAAVAAPNTFPEVMDPLELDTDQILLSLESPEQPLSPSHLVHLGEKRSWQNLQGSWGKRDAAAATATGVDDVYDTTNQLPPLITADDLRDYEDSSIPLNYALLLRNRPHQQVYPSEQKRAWKAINGAWGKRLSSGGGDWNKFRGSWGKREPGWNNLKGLWGKRSTNWNKLQSAWGKRDLSNNAPSTF